MIRLIKGKISCGSLDNTEFFEPFEPFLTIDFPFLSRTFSGLMEKPECTLLDDVLKDPKYYTFFSTLKSV
jgi:hypothetical protein